MATPPAIVELVGGLPPSSPQFWLDAATQAVRSYVGWHVAPVVTETITLDGRGGRSLLLPSLHVGEITSVLNDGVEVIDDVQMSTMGIISLDCGHWCLKLGGIQVTWTHGWPVDEVADLSGIIAKLASRAAVAAGNITRQNAGTMGVSYGTAGGLPPGTDLFQTEKDQLARYLMRMD